MKTFDRAVIGIGVVVCIVAFLSNLALWVIYIRLICSGGVAV